MERDTTVYKQAIQKEHEFEPFQGVWNIPGEERRSGVILYLCRDEKRMKYGIVLTERTGGLCVLLRWVSGKFGACVGGLSVFAGERGCLRTCNMVRGTCR